MGCGEACSASFQESNNYLLSIVVPTFNRQDELSKLLEQLSVELKDRQDEVEVIVSDNCSADKTSYVLHEFVAKQTNQIAIRCYTQTTNIGAPRNLHFLIDQSRAKYIWAVGDDDALVPGKISSILELLRKEQVNLLLVRAEGIGEWSRIPRRKEADIGRQYFQIELSDKGSADYLLAGGFLGSVIIQANAWRGVLHQVERLTETCYANWAAVLEVALRGGGYFVIDKPCVLGNFNMQGESQIPAFNILVLGRIKVWAAFKGTVLEKILQQRIAELARIGWAQIVQGKSRDIVTFAEKLQAFEATFSLLGWAGLRAYMYALVSFLVPFPIFWEKVNGLKNSALRNLARAKK